MKGLGVVLVIVGLFVAIFVSALFGLLMVIAGALLMLAGKSSPEAPERRDGPEGGAIYHCPGCGALVVRTTWGTCYCDYCGWGKADSA